MKRYSLLFGISILLLIKTIYRKKLFTSVNSFVHLNLSISLLLALAVFVSGIETAAASHVSGYKYSIRDTSIIVHTPVFSCTTFRCA